LALKECGSPEEFRAALATVLAPEPEAFDWKRAVLSGSTMKKIGIAPGLLHFCPFVTVDRNDQSFLWFTRSGEGCTSAKAELLPHASGNRQ